MSKLVEHLEPYGDLQVRVPEHDDMLSLARVTEFESPTDPSLRIAVITGDHASIPTALERALIDDSESTYLGEIDVTDLATLTEASAERLRFRDNATLTNAIVDDNGNVIARTDTFREVDGTTVTVVAERKPVVDGSVVSKPYKVTIPKPEGRACVLALIGCGEEVDDSDED